MEEERIQNKYPLKFVLRAATINVHPSIIASFLQARRNIFIAKIKIKYAKVFEPNLPLFLLL